MMQRFTESSYVRGFERRFYLPSIDSPVCSNWCRSGCIFLLLAVSDGQVVRIVRSYEFGDHSPIAFGVFAFALIGALWVLAVSLVSADWNPSALVRCLS